jgi:hypothetical protein
MDDVKMPASRTELNGLHSLIVKALTQRVEADMQDNVPTDAATMGAIIKLLKDNDITANPADDSELKDLRAKLSEASARRRQASKVVQLVQKDYDGDLAAGNM